MKASPSVCDARSERHFSFALHRPRRCPLAGRVATARTEPEELARRDVRVLIGAPAPTLAVLDGVERATGRAMLT